jgi:hypothetical protein
MKISIALFFILTINALTQDSLQKMSFTEFAAKAYLIQKKTNTFKIQKGTKVNFTLTITNGGEQQYSLKKEQFLTGFYMDNAREIAMPLKIEATSQEEYIEVKLKTYEKRILRLETLDQSSGDKYAQMMKIPKVSTKSQFLEYLKTHINQLTQLKSAAKAFDQEKTVKPGATLTFSGSGFIPIDAKKDTLREAYFTFKIFNSDGKPINIPVKAIFY